MRSEDFVIMILNQVGRLDFLTTKILITSVNTLHFIANNITRIWRSEHEGNTKLYRGVTK